MKSAKEQKNGAIQVGESDKLLSEPVASTRICFAPCHVYTGENLRTNEGKVLSRGKSTKEASFV
jgi:hypothetical protein